MAKKEEIKITALYERLSRDCLLYTSKKEKSRAYHRQYSREYRARNLEKQREYDRIKAREYRADVYKRQVYALFGGNKRICF